MHSVACLIFVSAAGVAAWRIYSSKRVIVSQPPEEKHGDVGFGRTLELAEADLGEAGDVRLAIARARAEKRRRSTPAP